MSTTIAPDKQFRALKGVSHGSNYRLGNLPLRKRMVNKRFRAVLAQRDSALDQMRNDPRATDEDVLDVARSFEAAQAEYDEWLASTRKVRSGRASRRVLAKERRDLASRAKGRDDLVSLRADVQKLSLSFMDSLAKSGITKADKSNSRKTRQQLIIDGRSQWYGRMMVMRLMQPLQQGISPSSVANAAGMSAMLYLFSSNFRDMVGSKLGGVRQTMRDKFYSRRDEKTRSKVEKAEVKGKTPRSKWVKRMEKLEFRERGHRELFTERTAAMVQIGLMESAYMEMRDPTVPNSRRDEHIAAVLDSYNSSMDILNAYIKDDGLNRIDVDKEMRLIVGDRLEAEPGLASVFNELAHGQFERSKATRKGRFDGKEVAVWDGRFVDPASGRSIIRGAFSLRIPGNRGDHIERCADVLENDLAQATSLDDLNEIFAAYTAASLVRRFPHMKSGEKVVDERIVKTQRMFETMDQDGLSMLDKRYVYNEAFVAAMERVGKQNPDLMKQWTNQYGETWKKDIKSVVDTFSEVGRSAERAEIIRFLTERNYSSAVAEKVADAHIELDEVQERLMQNPDEAREKLGQTVMEADDTTVIQEQENIDQFVEEQSSAPPVGTDEKVMHPTEEVGVFSDTELPDVPNEDPRFAAKPKYTPLNLPTRDSEGSMKDKVMDVMEELAFAVENDIEVSYSRQGTYIKGTYEQPYDLLDSEDELEHRGSEEFVNAAMDDWRNMAQLAQEGNKYLAYGFGSLTGPELATARRSALAASAMRALDDLGVPAVTRDQMLGAATVLGIEQAMCNDLAMSYINENLDSYGGTYEETSEGWRSQIYEHVVLNTPSGRADPVASIKRGYKLWAGMFDDYKDEEAKDIHLDAVRDEVLKPVEALVKGADERHARKIVEISEGIHKDAIDYEQDKIERDNKVTEEYSK